MGLSLRGRTKGENGWINYSASGRGLGASVSYKVADNVTLNYKPSRGLRWTVNFGHGVRWVSSTKRNTKTYKEPKRRKLTSAEIRIDEQWRRHREREISNNIAAGDVKMAEIENIKSKIESAEDELHRLMYTEAESYHIVAKKIQIDRHLLELYGAIDYLQGYIFRQSVLARAETDKMFAIDEIVDSIEAIEETIAERLSEGWSTSELYYIRKLKERNETYRELLIAEAVKLVKFKKAEKAAKDSDALAYKLKILKRLAYAAGVFAIGLWIFM